MAAAARPARRATGSVPNPYVTFLVRAGGALLGGAAGVAYGLWLAGPGLRGEPLGENLRTVPAASTVAAIGAETAILGAVAAGSALSWIRGLYQINGPDELADGYSQL
jgi:hypothetical protein